MTLRVGEHQRPRRCSETHQTAIVRALGGIVTFSGFMEEESWHFKVGNPACQETDSDERRSRALLIVQAGDRIDADSSTDLI